MFEELRQLGPAALVEAVESMQRQESRLVARRLAAVAALLRHRAAAAERSGECPEYAAIDAFERTAAEVAAAMNLSASAAGYVVSYAQALDTRLPKMAALLAEGKTDWRTVRLIISRTDLITDERPMAELDASLAARIGNWSNWSRQRIVNAVDAAVRAVDPDAARERREAADKDRYIAVTAGNNGMAEVHGAVAATAAKAFDGRLSQLANQVCPADPRTMDQRRADALTALSQGIALACGCGRADCPARTGDEPARAAGATRVVINVVAADDTVHGDGAAPGYLEGHGLIDADEVRELLAAAAARRRPGHEPGGRLALSADGLPGARGALPGLDLPLPGVQPTGRRLRPGPHGSVQPSESGSRRADGVPEPEMPLPPTP
ncbi:13e12 repeat-containing protein [Mycobacterium bohemicum DSM 44277]|uniref:13e12 repeat-containing protein n=1 Tax=Mycobacterium bohemicum DSM 44277 TaxID=1236609 RepID=A0A0U0WD90_MYCBE|nr:13e12 repeat-containing protein [Mycobacterium bohemicum DSM 44277]